MEDNKGVKIVEITLKSIFCIAVTLALYYFIIPPISIFSAGFWVFAIIVLAGAGLVFGVLDLSFLSDKKVKKKKQKKTEKNSNIYIRSNKIIPGDKTGAMTLASKIYTGIIIGAVVLFILCLIISAPIFQAGNFAGVIEVSESDFAKDMPEVSKVTDIALMDTDSAKKLGDRKLGALANVVSQFVVSESYTQINYKGKPKKVASLEYDGYFKWLGNRDTGVPGYVMVDAIDNYADYVELESGIKYTESAYFSEDLRRALRFAYPTKIFGNISFEVDEDGKAFYIVSCMKPKAGLFGAMDVSEVIMFNPVDGSHSLLSLGEIPSWVDIVYDGDLACEKYDWKGLYSGGFFNSIIGNKGCKQTTDDFGYIMRDDDVWYFTGVTSITADSSNIGFILSNARTGEYKFYPVIGAEEHSAMGAAEGEVQEKGYTASFPSLVNISGQPSYIMVLKDANGLVKLYALVNVQQYNMVATGETQSEAMSAYIKTLRQNGIAVNDPDIGDDDGDKNAEDFEIKIADMKYLALSGTTYVYITAEDGKVFRMEFNAENEGIILKRVGDTLRGKATPEKNGIYSIISWKAE